MSILAPSPPGNPQGHATTGPGTTRIRRDCRCKRARHRHGTRAAYERDRCRCLRCRAAHANAVREYRHGRKWREGRLVPGIGTARRLRALAYIGHSAAAVGTHLDMSGEMVVHYRRLTHQQITIEVARAVAAVYDHLWDQPNITSNGRRCSTQAARFGWHPPLAWDDDEIDSIDARPRTGRKKSNPDRMPCGTAAAARRHWRHGEPLDEACRAAARRQRSERRAA